jgi:hypothetical protein
MRVQDQRDNFPYTSGNTLWEGALMEARYNVYFSGQLLAGRELATVRANLGKLFNANEATLNKLFSGKAQLVKRDCDKATALKYKQAIEKAGGIPDIKTVAATPVDEAQSAAERIAALASAPDLGAQQPATEPEGNPEAPGTQTDVNIALAPSGTEVLLAEERAAPVASSVNALDLDVDTSGERLSDALPTPPAAPDTSHLSEGAVGEILPNLPSSATALDPDTSGISLSPDGSDFSDCAAPASDAPELDLSGIDLAPAGADVIEPQYRKKQDTPPPATDHLALED